jgi:hypothetical protein
LYEALLTGALDKSSGLAAVRSLDATSPTICATMR